MINRLQLLRNIGQFDSVDSAASIPLERLTVLYSENGRGKTTLAAVLRSLSTGDPLPIAERRRLASEHPPHVVLECTGGSTPAVFQNNAWNRTLADLVVFDDVFIDENVHSGLTVDARHRQNLHEWILGSQAVDLSQEHDRLVRRIETHNAELRAKSGAIPAAERGQFSINEFCALQPEPDIDQLLQEAERALAAAREAEAIRTNAPFNILNLPTFDIADIESLLRQDLPSIDTASLAKVQAHLGKLGEGGESWVGNGMHRADDAGSGSVEGTCPFCAQPLQGSTIVEHYRAFFSEAYTNLKRRTADMLQSVERDHGGAVQAGFECTVRIAVERRQFWSRFCEIPEIRVDTAAIIRDWNSAREAIITTLMGKQAAPLERLEFSDEMQSKISQFEMHKSTINNLNQRLEEANRAIEVAKEKSASANLSVLTQDLARLKAVKSRHSKEIADLCEDYLKELAAKQDSERQRDQVKANLEQHRANVFPDYGTRINVYLQRFNADFRLDSVFYANTRGGPACTYNVLINRVTVPIGGGDPGSGGPSFRNTLLLKFLHLIL